jgi:hypothetical protein
MYTPLLLLFYVWWVVWTVYGGVFVFCLFFLGVVSFGVVCCFLFFLSNIFMRGCGSELIVCVPKIELVGWLVVGPIYGLRGPLSVLV